MERSHPFSRAPPPRSLLAEGGWRGSSGGLAADGRRGL